MLISLSGVLMSIYSVFPSMVGWLYVDLLRFVVPLVVVSPLALSMVNVDMYVVPWTSVLMNLVDNELMGF